MFKEHNVEDSLRGMRPQLSFNELDRPDSLLNRLAGGTEQADPFCCRTEWQFSFHEAFSPDRSLFFRGSDTSLIAFAGYQHPDGIYVLEPIESSWLFGCPLLGPDAPDLLESLLHSDPFCSNPLLALLSGLAPGSALLRNIVRAHKHRFRIIRLESSLYRCGFLTGGLDGYLSRRSGKMRRNLRRAAAQAAGRGVTFERCVPLTVGQAEETYARMSAIEEKSWKGIGKCGMNIPPSGDFYRFMLRRLSYSGCGRVIFAVCEGRDIGFVFGGIAGSYYRGQQFSYDEGWSGYSIGSLLQIEKIKWLCEEGIGRYDMGQAMEYKIHWAELELRTENLLLRQA